MLLRKIAMRLTEREIIQYLQSAADEYLPLRVASLERQVLLSGGTRADAIIQFSIPDGPCFKALAEIVSVASPKIILDRSRRLVDCLGEIDDTDMVPLIIAPFVGAKQAKILADKGISWMDLSGNMSIKVSNRIYIERTGKKNRFPDTAPIKKVFQGASSLVSRALLLKPRGFSSLYEIVDFINGRNSNITLSTVSKVLKSLEQELLIDRSKPLVSVIDRAKLLEKLAEGYANYAKIKQGNTYSFSIKQLRCGSMRLNVDKSNYLASGYYAAQIKGLAVSNEVTFIVKNVEQARGEFDFLEPDAEFGNVTLIESKEDSIWFNSVETELTIASVINVTVPIVDDIGLYLEMMVDTPRGPKIARILKKRILEKADTDG